MSQRAIDMWAQDYRQHREICTLCNWDGEDCERAKTLYGIWQSWVEEVESERGCVES